MLNEERIRKMTELSRFQEGPGKKDLEICRYYRGDYIGVNLIKNFFLTSIGYVALVGTVLLYFLEYLLSNITQATLLIVGTEVVIGYLIALVVYTAVTYIVCSAKYEAAQKRVRGYYDQLGQLERLYQLEKKQRQS